MATYEESYTKEVAQKWENKGGKDAYIKAAKAWNQKKYGTAEPTAKAKKMTGGSKVELAKEKRRMDNPDIKTAKHGEGTFYKWDSGQSRSGMRAPDVKSYHNPKYGSQHPGKFGGFGGDGDRKARVYTDEGLVQPLKAVNIPLKSATDTKSNERIKQVVASAQGPKTRKEKRFDRRTEAGRRTKEITTDSAGVTTKTIRKGTDVKKKVTKKSKGNYRSPSASTISSMGKLIS